jgi:hypothetical protein
MLLTVSLPHDVDITALSGLMCHRCAESAGCRAECSYTPAHFHTQRSVVPSDEADGGWASDRGPCKMRDTSRLLE